MNISAWAIRNPVPAILLFFLLCGWGILGFRGLPIQQFPDIDLPTVSVSVSLRGAAPDQMESEVARPLEDELAGVEGIRHIRTTISEGSANIIAEFSIDTDPEKALSLARDAAERAKADLPAEAEAPIVSKITTASAPFISFAVRSPVLDPADLSWTVDDAIERQLLSIPGIARVARIGGVDREILVTLRPDRARELGLSPLELSASIRALSSDASGGHAYLGGAEQITRAVGLAKSLRDLSDMSIALPNGSMIRLSEIADISDAQAEPSSLAFVGAEPTVAFEVFRSKGASEAELSARVRSELAAFDAARADISLEEVSNASDHILDNYRGSMLMLYEGALLAVIVVLGFLRDWRATLIAALALPLSILPAFGAMHWLGFSLNGITLLALALVVGVLVDDAIVEIENIFRHLRMGKSPYQAAMEAADEIGMAVVATTLTLMAVFLPTAFMSGIPGKFFREFGVTAAVAVFSSLLVARLLTPMMAAYLLKALPPLDRSGFWLAPYLSAAKGALSKPNLALLFGAAIVAGSIGLLPLLPASFMPAQDQGRTRISLELPPGSSLGESRAAALRAESMLRGIPEIERIFVSVGRSSAAGPFGEGAASSPNIASLQIQLTHRESRQRKQIEIEREARERLAALPGVRVSVGLGAPGENMVIALASADPVGLGLAAEALEREIRSIPGLGNVSSNASLLRPEISAIADVDLAAKLGVTTRAIGETLRGATLGEREAALPNLDLPGRQIPIRVRLPDAERENLAALETLPVPARNGMIPLAAAARLQLSSSAAAIERIDRRRVAKVSVELNGADLGAALEKASALPALRNLPAGVEMVPEGDAELMRELFEGFAIAMAIGVFCIFATLTLLFRDFLHPATILTALPLSLGGALLALLWTSNALSLPSIIGLLMLMGIVTKNSILLVDYSIRAKNSLASPAAAALEACEKRARPVLMTSLAMVAGMLPSALGLGAESSFRSPMAIAVIGGLTASTVLSLLIVPAAFVRMESLKRFFRKKESA